MGKKMSEEVAELEAGIEAEMEAELAELERLKAKYEELTKPNPKKIDWSKMPKDTLVEVRNCDTSGWKKRHFSNACMGRVFCFDNGATSETMTGDSGWTQIRLIENKPQPWFGGECPLPGGIKVKVSFRDDSGKSFVCASQVLDWENLSSSADIIAFQILGPMEGWE